MSIRIRIMIVRIVAVVLLAMASADLLVPNLCGAEMAASSQASQAAGDQDDCFCCCAHTDSVPFVVVAESSRIPVVLEQRPTEALAPGVPRSLYHPPLHV